MPETARGYAGLPPDVARFDLGEKTCETFTVIVEEMHVSKPLNPADLPEDIAQAALAHVAAGRFSSVEDVLRAGIDAVGQEPPALPRDWADFLRYRFEEGRAAFARGEAVTTHPDAIMDSIEAELNLE